MIEESIRGNIDSSTVDMITSVFDTKLFISRSIGQLISGYEDDLLEASLQFNQNKVKSNVFSLTMGVRNLSSFANFFSLFYDQFLPD